MKEAVKSWQRTLTYRKEKHESTMTVGSRRMQTRLERIRRTDLRCEISISIRKIGLYDVAYLATELVDFFHGLNSWAVRVECSQRRTLSTTDLLPHKVLSTELRTSTDILISPDDREEPKNITATIPQRRVCLCSPFSRSAKPQRDVFTPYLLVLEEGTAPYPLRLLSFDLLTSDIL